MPSTRDQDSRPLLLEGPSLGLRLIVIGVISIALMVADHRLQYLPVVRGWLSAAVYPVHWAVNAPFVAWRALSDALATRARLQADNVRLDAENLVLQLRMQRFEALERENQRLREAREGSSRVVQRSLVAEILKVDLDPYRQRVLVNKGTRDGVFKDQAALDADGVFGQVARVGAFFAEVIMISDPEHAVPVQINRTGVRTIAVGTGRPDLMSLPYLPRSADVEPGDLVISSGLGGVFPPGYPVALVQDVVRDPAQQLLVVTARPLARLDRDPEVLLVWFDNPVAGLEDPDPTAPAAAAGEEG